MQTFSPFAPFSAAGIRAELSASSGLLLRQLTLLDSIDSTNLALQALPAAEQHAHALVADRQTAGRGRRGRQWHSPPGRNIYLSLGWHFDQAGGAITPLPLAVAVSLARALRRVGIAEPGIKWPNDLQAGGSKLAGILVEMRSAAPGRALAVIGIGINVCMPAEAVSGGDIGQSWTDVCSQLRQPAAAGLRDRLCGIVLDELLQGAAQFAAQGFEPFAADWRRWDVLRGREVVISCAGEVLSGTADGITPGGGLLVSCRSAGGEPRLREFVAGEVSIRPASPL
jgi:BirA family biotin operon repressor/biotin-[acetyl-CoA-carboxylase] ligase